MPSQLCLALKGRPEKRWMIATPGALLKWDLLIFYEYAIVEGEHFGPANVTWNSVTGTYGTATEEYEALDCKVEVPHVKVRCRMNQGAGRKHSWSLIIGDQLSRSPTSSYGIPEIHKLQGDGAVAASTNGGQTVNVVGLNLDLIPLAPL